MRLFDRERSDFPACRLGSVPYLNARPLIFGLEGIVSLDVPARLAERFAAGELDAALVPIYEALERERAVIADDVAIACRGEVFSVYLAHREPLAEIRAVALDPASHTSNHLLQCVLAEFHRLEPRYAPAPEDAGQARLLIGDAAVDFRRRGGEGWKFLDLGAEWMRGTGLPFVFAAWVFREGFEGAAAVAAALRAVKRRGLEGRAEIAAASGGDAEFGRRYLTEFIRFDLGAEEKRAIERFASMLRKHGLIGDRGGREISYV